MEIKGNYNYKFLMQQSKYPHKASTPQKHTKAAKAFISKLRTHL